MEIPFRICFLCFLAILSTAAWSQDRPVVANDDEICLGPGEPPSFDVTINDSLGGLAPYVFLISGQEFGCFRLSPEGLLSLIDPNDGACCGEYTLRYRIEQCDGSTGECVATIHLTVKCPKPNCSLIDLEDWAGDGMDPTGGGGNPLPKSCVSACENSNATYFVSYNPNYTYTWAVTGGAYLAGANAAEIIVTWGSPGSGNVSVGITDNANSGRKVACLEVCVDILPGPTADFAPEPDTVCLGNPMGFDNLSSGGNSFLWDFGDGNFSTTFEPTHTYAGPGVYTATLYVTRDNYDLSGNPLCCCTDSISRQVVVNDLPGPGIFWVSTLCAHDNAKYWTDATDCGSLTWTVLDENGVLLPFDGQGQDTICVDWGNGPFGTILLQVEDCTGAYCDQPTSVMVPIIPAAVGITGSVEVCLGDAEIYTVPKWMGVVYDWQISGGAILSGAGTNTVLVHWDVFPGPGSIQLQYYSDFLSGLPCREDVCGGSGALPVDILPVFDIMGPFSNTVCTNSTSVFSATASPSSAYNWTIDPPASFSGQGANFITVNWDQGPGLYTISATPVDPTAYCNDSVTVFIQVVEILPPDGIDGPDEICPGETYTYYAQTPASGVGFSWNITGGSPSFFNGDPVTVTWGASGPYSITLQQFQLNAPYCVSDPISLSVNPKTLNGPLVLTGPDGCINSVQSYSVSPAQDPGAGYEWSVSPVTAGSVITGNGTPSVQVQWNNDAGSAAVIVKVKLCGDSLLQSLNLPLNAPVQPLITQTGDLCPGVAATLDAGSSFSAYQWSGGATTESINITGSGTYTVTTTDANGCTAVDAYEAFELPGPVADISTPDPLILCIIPPNSQTVTIAAQTNANYLFEWFCNGASQGAPSTQATFVHTNTNVVATFAYWAVVTDVTTGCMATSNTLTVIQTDECEGPPCPAETYSLSFGSIGQTPDCNIVDFTASASVNVTLSGWNFGDPGNNTNSGSLINAQHIFTKAGYFIVTLNGTVPQEPPNSGTCPVSTLQSVCIPLAADFDYQENCGTVQFTDLSTFIPANNITNWNWNFGDSNTALLQHPSHTYTAPGAYPVTLTVSNANGCSATIIRTVVYSGPPAPVISVDQDTVCVGDAVAFAGSAAGNIISWFWDFADGATNGGQNPSHTFLSPGAYSVSLTVTDAAGCTGATALPVQVFASPPAGQITASPGFTICEGETVTLTAPVGDHYLWSTGATTASITTGLAGSYGLTITDAHNCELTPEEVKVIVHPRPEAFISGPEVICDTNCVVLTAPPGFGYTYQWLDDSGTPLPPSPGLPPRQFEVCWDNLLPAYSVVVTDANGCSDTSSQHYLSVAASPVFDILATPDSCEGSASLLTVDPIDPNVTYSWSTGLTGTAITVFQAGTYTVIGRDNSTGCAGIASAVIHPQPDLCLVPTGCYEICNPDTICGPVGLAAYQWNKNGAPIAGGTAPCLIVTESGSYSLTGINQFGCSLTTDTLILETVDCMCDSLPCDDLAVTATLTDSCCWSLTYDHQAGLDLFGLNIRSEGADLNPDLSGLDPTLNVYSQGNNWISLVSDPVSAPLPVNLLSDFLHLCLENVQQYPPQIIIDWYDFDLKIVCSDTLTLDCRIEPDCLYTASDSIYCANGEVVYDLLVCNPADNDFSISYIQLLPESPAGILISPPVINDPSNPLDPGHCRHYTFTLSGATIAGQDFCYQLLGHSADPTKVDTALCCSLDTIYCVTIPDCYACDDIGVKEVVAAKEGCCYDIYLYNNYAADYFDGIDLCLLSPNTSFSSLDNPFGSGWTTAGYTATAIQLDAAPPVGGSVPLGSLQLPRICIATEDPPAQALEIKWMQGDSVICRDTIDLSCKPECAYISKETLSCNGNGTWNFQWTVENTSAYVMDQAQVVFTQPGGMSIYDQAFNLGGLPPNGTAGPFNLVFGAPAMPGDTVCFTVAMHQTGHDDRHLNCCNFSYCIILPDCPPNENCTCDLSFFSVVNQGFIARYEPAPYTATFTPRGTFYNCDRISWSFSDATGPDYSIGNGSVTHTFPGKGSYLITIRVVRLGIDGQECEKTVTRGIRFGETRYEPALGLYPNPSGGAVWLRVEQPIPGPVFLRLLSVDQQVIHQWRLEKAEAGAVFPVRIPEGMKGLFLMEIRTGQDQWIKKLIVE